MRLYRTSGGAFVEADQVFYPVTATSWDELLTSAELQQRAKSATQGTGRASLDGLTVLAPVESQEVWASGVTYYRSRNARIEESKDSGGGDFYDRVYTAERPELFFKSVGSRVIRPGGSVRIRKDSKWNVPEPELVLVINSAGEIVGLTVGNDMSSRDIEGENPLYLPQAKVYDGSCAIGPCILILEGPIDKNSAIRLEIQRNGATAFEGSTTLQELKRDPKELVSYLYREMTFAEGAMLFTGTGIVPGDDFTLHRGDEVLITIDDIGTLENVIA